MESSHAVAGLELSYPFAYFVYVAGDVVALIDGRVHPFWALPWSGLVVAGSLEG